METCSWSLLTREEKEMFSQIQALAYSSEYAETLKPNQRGFFPPQK